MRLTVTEPGANNPAGVATRVLIVENEETFRSLLVNALSLHPTIQVVAAVATGEEALRMADGHRPDVVLMDIELGSQLDGIRAAHLIKAAHPSIGIVILSMHRDREYLASLPDRRAGGWSFLLKQSLTDTSVLVRAIEGAAWGLVSMDPSIVDELSPRRRSVLERLTNEQTAVLRLMSAGYGDDAICRKLGVSPLVLQRRIRSIYRDLHLDSNEKIDARVTAILTYLRESSETAEV